MQVNSMRLESGFPRVGYRLDPAQGETVVEYVS